MARLNRSSDVKASIESFKRDIRQAKAKAMVEYASGELTDVQQRIANRKTDPYARPWAPWSFATRQQRIRMGNAMRGLLYRTGALLRSFRATIRGDRVTISSNLPYAEYLQNGRANMRRRVIVDLGSKLSMNRLTKALKRNLGKIK